MLRELLRISDQILRAGSSSLFVVDGRADEGVGEMERGVDGWRRDCAISRECFVGVGEPCSPVWSWSIETIESLDAVLACSTNVSEDELRC